MSFSTGCPEPEELFAYSARMLSQRQEARLGVHVRACARCREAVAQYARLGGVLDEWKPTAPSPWFDARVRTRTASLRPPRFSLSLAGMAWVRWAAIAAVGFIVVFGGLRLAELGLTHRVRGAAESKMTASAAVTSVAPQARFAGSPSAASSDRAAVEEIDLYKNLPMLENYDMLANFDVLSELPQAASKRSD
jgi:hypothetical protein